MASNATISHPQLLVSPFHPFVGTVLWKIYPGSSFGCEIKRSWGFRHDWIVVIFQGKVTVTFWAPIHLQPSIWAVGWANGQMLCLHSPSPVRILTQRCPKSRQIGTKATDCIVMLLNREKYHWSTSRAAKFRKKNQNRTMRSERFCASKDQTRSEEAAIEAPFRRDPAPMRLPDRRCLGLVGTVAAFGFASYVSVWRMLPWSADFTHAYGFFELFVHGLFGHGILPDFTFRNFPCRNTPRLYKGSESLDWIPNISRWYLLLQWQHLRLILGGVTANYRPNRATYLETGRNQGPAKPLSPE